MAKRILDKWLEEGYHSVSGTDNLMMQDLDYIEGIGPSYMERLNEAGVMTLMDLWLASPVIVANRSGLAVSLIQRWQEMADLSRVEGVGQQYAELLVSAGIDTVQQLASSEVESLLSSIEQALEEYPNMVGTRPGEESVEKWILNALTINMKGAPYTGPSPASKEG